MKTVPGIRQRTAGSAGTAEGPGRVPSLRGGVVIKDVQKVGSRYTFRKRFPEEHMVLFTVGTKMGGQWQQRRFMKLL